MNNEAYSDQRLKDIEAKRERYLEAHQLRGDYAEVIPFCRHCGDTGQIEGVLCFCAERLYKSLQPRLFDAALSPDETFEAIDPVSYTHLDVYKRQERSPHDLA